MLQGHFKPREEVNSDMEILGDCFRVSFKGRADQRAAQSSPGVSTAAAMAMRQQNAPKVPPLWPAAEGTAVHTVHE